MSSARTAIENGLSHIEEQVKALEQAVYNNAGLAFDLAKTLVESTCKTILTERGAAFDKNEDLPGLLRLVKHTVPFLPAEHAGEVDARRSLEKTLSGLSTTLLGVTELRNSYGFASHGSDGFRPVMSDIQALLAAQAADAIVGFLYSVHHQDISRGDSKPPAYSDNESFNDWLDDNSAPVEIYNLPPYRPSEVLFNVDYGAYADLLATFQSETELVDDGEEAQEAGTANESD
jgi:hypothetical protein